MRRRNILILLSSLVVLAVAVAGGIIAKNYFKKNNNNPYNKLEYKGGNDPVTIRFPGEFEKQQAIWLEWPRIGGSYNAGSHPVNPVMVTLAKTMANYERVNIMINNNNEIQTVKDLLKSSGYTGTNIHYYLINHASIWARDVGPIFVKDSQNGLRVVTFGFNNYSRDGNQDYINIENQVDGLTAGVLKLPVIKSSLISEGGAIESNGKGTLMVPEAVALKRNPGMTKQQIENEYKRVFGLKKVIWLKKGLAEDDAVTSGHINEFARFANADTILLAQVPEKYRNANWASKESYLRMEENYNILKNATDQDGKPFKIIRIPLPPSVYGVADETGAIPVRSYLNYALVNGAVMMQSYYKTGRSSDLKATEDKVKSIFASVFPGRQIIGVDAENVNRWGGGLHCITQHMPAQ